MTGSNGVTTEVLQKTNVKQLIVEFPGSGAITALDYRWCPPASNQAANAVVASTMPASKCPAFTMDFNSLRNGDYVTNDFFKQFGVTIAAYSASGGYTPNNAARICNSGLINRQGNAALGSPNGYCPGGRHPGQGDGGKPGSAFANCNPQGNLLIVQDAGQRQPYDNPTGGSIRFKFERPAYIESVTIMNIVTDANQPKLMSVHCDGTASVNEGVVTGQNGVAVNTVNQDDTDQFWVMFPTGGAVSQLVYRMCT